MSKSYVKKITMATIGVDPRLCESITSGKGAEAVPVARIIGTVREAKPGTSELGPFVKFSGEFQGTNVLTGEVYRSNSLILPSVAEGFVSDGISSAKADDPTASLQFAADITAIENKSSKGGFKFRYGVTPLLGPKGDDVLDSLAASLPPVKGIAAPKKK